MPKNPMLNTAEQMDDDLLHEKMKHGDALSPEERERLKLYHQKEEKDKSELNDKLAMGEALDTQEQERMKIYRQNDMLYQKELNERRAKIERKASKVADRKRLKESIVGHYVPSMQEGSMAKARHLAGLTAEGVAAELMIDLLIFAFEVLTIAPYHAEKQKYDAALKQEVDAIAAGNKVQLVYRENEKGKWPKIYYADPQTGELDYDRIIPHDKVTSFDIRANGLIPVPSVKEGLLAAFDRHVERMDPSWLTPDQKLRIHGVVEQADRATKGRDLAAERLAQQAMMRGGK